MRIFLRNCIESLLHALRDHTFLIFKYKMLASDHSFLAFDRGRNAMRHHILHLCMTLIMGQPSYFRCFYNRFCHRVWKMLFHTSCQTKQFVGVFIHEWNHIHNRRFCLGQCTCLIKDDGIRLCNGFQISASFNGHIIGSCLSDS